MIAVLHDYALEQAWKSFMGRPKLTTSFWLLFMHTNKPVDSTEAWEQCSPCAELFWLESK